MNHEQEILQQLATLEAEVRTLNRQQADMAGKIDSLAAVANVGRGALWMLLKIGAAVAALAALAAAVAEWGSRA